MEFDQSFNALLIRKAAPGPGPTPSRGPTPPTPSANPTSPAGSTPTPPASGSSIEDYLKPGYKITKEDTALDKFLNAFIAVATQKGQSGDQARAFILQKKTNLEQLTGLIGPEDTIKYWKDFIDKNSLTPQDTFKIFESAISCSYSSGTNTRDILDFGLAFTVANRDPETLKFIMDETCTLSSLNPNVQPFKILSRAIKGEKFDARDSTFFKYDNPLHSAMLNRLMSLSVLTKQTDDVLSSDEAARLIDLGEKARTLASVERELNNYLFRGDYAKIESDNINQMRQLFKNSLSDPFAQAFRRMFFIFDMGQNLQQQILQNIGVNSSPETKRNFGPTFKKSNNEQILRLAADDNTQTPEVKEPSLDITGLTKIIAPYLDSLKELISLLKSFEDDPVLGNIVKPLLGLINLLLNAEALYKAITSGSILDLIKNIESVAKGVDISGVKSNLQTELNKKQSHNYNKFIKVAQFDLGSVLTGGQTVVSGAIQGFALSFIIKNIKSLVTTIKSLSSKTSLGKEEQEQLSSSRKLLLSSVAFSALWAAALAQQFYAMKNQKKITPRDTPNQADNFEWLRIDNAQRSQLQNIEISWKKSVEAAKTQVKILQAESNSQIATDLAGSKSPAPISSPEKLKQSFEEFRKTLDSALNFTYYYQEVLTKAYNDNKVAIESDETKAGQARAAFYKIEAALTELKQFDTEYGTLEKIIDNIQAIAIIYRDLEPDMQQVLNYNELGVGVPALIGYKGLIGKIDGILQQRILAQNKLQQEILSLQSSNDPRLLDYKNLGKEESTDPSKKLTLTAPSTEMQGEARDRKVSALKAQLAKMETEIAKIDGYKRKLLKGEISKFGGKSEKFIKVSDKPKSYDTEEFEFYDNLLGNPDLVEPAGYGTILEDPEQYRNIPSTEVKPKFRKVNQV